MYPIEEGLFIILSLYFLAFVIFLTGLFAVIFGGRSLVLVLLGLELLLLGITLLTLLTSKLSGALSGQLALFLYLVLGGAESGVGLALVMLYYRQKGTILLKHIRDVKF